MRPPRPADPRAGIRRGAARSARGARRAPPAPAGRRPWRGRRARRPTSIRGAPRRVPGLGASDGPPHVWVAETCAGYCSDEVKNALTADRVVPLLRGRFGRPYEYQEHCPSTQELVRGPPEGAVAVTDHQTAGRGRRGRTWSSPPGTGILFSLALRPATPPERLAPLSLVLAEAVCEALDERALVRWPNDVTVEGRKLAGVLPELRDGQVTAGIGVNANLEAGDLPPDARVPATSLQLLRGAPVDRAGVLAALLASIEGALRPVRAGGLHRPAPRRAARAAGDAGRGPQRPVRRRRRRGPPVGGRGRPHLRRGRAGRGRRLAVGGRVREIGPKRPVAR